MVNTISYEKNSFIHCDKVREVYFIWQWDSIPTYPGVYFIYNKNDELLYVGKAQNINKRLKCHYEGNTHISQYMEHFYRVETHEVKTGRMDCLFYEIYYINKYHPIFNKENVLYTNQQKVKEGIQYYLNNCNPLITKRIEAEKTQEDLGLPPEDGHLFTLWVRIQDGRGNEHTYHCNQGGSVANKILQQWVVNEKTTFLNNIIHYYNLSSVEEVERQLKDFVRWDKMNIFSLSSDPNKGWFEREIAEQYY